MSIMEKAERLHGVARDLGIQQTAPSWTKRGNYIHVLYTHRWLKRLVLSRNGYVKARVEHDGKKETYSLGRNDEALQGLCLLVGVAVFYDWK